MWSNQHLGRHFSPVCGMCGHVLMKLIAVLITTSIWHWWHFKVIGSKVPVTDSFSGGIIPIEGSALKTIWFLTGPFCLNIIYVSFWCVFCIFFSIGRSEFCCQYQCSWLPGKTRVRMTDYVLSEVINSALSLT